MALTSFIRKLVGRAFQAFGLLFFLVALYGFAVSQPGVGVFYLIISAVFVGIGLWILQVRWMRRLLSRFESRPGPPSMSFTPPNLDNLVAELQSFPKRSFRDRRWIPSTGGVYVIYDKRSALYVGRTNNLYRRLKHEHLEGQGNSALRRELMSRMGFSGRQVNEYLTDQCEFQYVELADANVQTDLEHQMKLKLHPYINF